MKTEQQQTPLKFTTKKGNFDISLEMKAEQNNRILKIQLFDQLNLEIYEKRIDSAYIVEYQQMNNIFQTPEDIYETLQVLIEEITITQEGDIVFEIDIGGIKKRKKSFKIKTCKKQLNKMELMALKLEKVQKNSEIIQAENKELKAKIIQIQRSNKEILIKLEHLTLENKQLKSALTSRDLVPKTIANGQVTKTIKSQDKIQQLELKKKQKQEEIADVKQPGSRSNVSTQGVTMQITGDGYEEIAEHLKKIANKEAITRLVIKNTVNIPLMQRMQYVIQSQQCINPAYSMMYIAMQMKIECSMQLLNNQAYQMIHTDVSFNQYRPIMTQILLEFTGLRRFMIYIRHPLWKHQAFDELVAELNKLSLEIIRICIDPSYEQYQLYDWTADLKPTKPGLVKKYLRWEE